MSPSDLETDTDPQGIGEPQSIWDAQGLWQAQKKELDPVTLAHIHAKAVNFEKQVHLRTATNYLAIGFGIVAASAAAALLPRLPWLMRAGEILMVLGLVFVAWQLFRRTAPQSLPLLGESLMDTYRRQLIRQRDAARTEFWWSILPTVPGLLLMFVGIWLKGPAPGGTLRFYLSMMLLPVLLTLGFSLAAYLIGRNVQRLQKLIDEL
jgi:hypothetical protein